MDIFIDDVKAVDGTFVVDHDSHCPGLQRNDGWIFGLDQGKHVIRAEAYFLVEGENAGVALHTSRERFTVEQETEILTTFREEGDPPITFDVSTGDGFACL